MKLLLVGLTFYVIKMPPKTSKKSTKSKPADDSAAEDMGEEMSPSKQSSLEAFLDEPLKQQTDQLNTLFLKFSKSTKAELDEIKKSQEFLGSKFDDLINKIANNYRKTTRISVPQVLNLLFLLYLDFPLIF